MEKLKLPVYAFLYFYFVLFNFLSGPTFNSQSGTIKIKVLEF